MHFVLLVNLQIPENFILFLFLLSIITVSPIHNYFFSTKDDLYKWQLCTLIIRVYRMTCRKFSELHHNVSNYPFGIFKLFLYNIISRGCNNVEKFGSENTNFAGTVRVACLMQGIYRTDENRNPTIWKWKNGIPTSLNNLDMNYLANERKENIFRIRCASLR